VNQDATLKTTSTKIAASAVSVDSKLRPNVSSTVHGPLD
jgi:hypothetical protein